MAAWPFILVLHRYLQWEVLGKAAAWRGMEGEGHGWREWLWGPTGNPWNEGSVGPCQDSQVRLDPPALGVCTPASLGWGLVPVWVLWWGPCAVT